METVNEQVSKENKYKVIYVDAPWRDKSWPIHRLRGLPVETWAANDAMLLMWTCNELLMESLQLLYTWEFKYEGLLVWEKPKEELEASWTRNQCELIIVGARGTAKTSYLLKHTLYEGGNFQGDYKPLGFRTLLWFAGDVAFDASATKLDLFGGYWKGIYPEYEKANWDFVEG